MRKIVKTNNNLDNNLMGESFNSTINKTIFSLGDFSLTSNFEPPERGDDISEGFGGFAKPLTLEKLKIRENVSLFKKEKDQHVTLNLDYSELGSFVRFGSTKEYLRMCVERIILKFPFGIFMDRSNVLGGNDTINNYQYDSATNTSEFDIPLESVSNPSGIIIENNNDEISNNNPLSNLSLNYSYFSLTKPEEMDYEYEIIEFTGVISNSNKLTIKVKGNPFPNLTGTTGRIEYHIKPRNRYYKDFKRQLINFEKHIMSKRDGLNGYLFELKIPQQLENGDIVYAKNSLLWPTTDGYNIDISGSRYGNFLNALQNAGMLYDSVKTDIIYNLLIPKSVLNYDLTKEHKISKLFRVYGSLVDDVRVFIDSLVYIHSLSYDKINNVPDRLLNNLARTLGWKDILIKTEDELVDLVLNPGELDGSEDSFDDINIELWRRILINTNYFWESKGTRQSIISILNMLGIPERFLTFNEFIYISDNKINPNTTTLKPEDFPNNSLPYDKDGYPSVPIESNDFFFQVSGVTDNGQTYLDTFRKAGFNINPYIDNQKITLLNSNHAENYDVDNRLIINTKTVDLGLDIAGFIEKDFYDYEVTVDYPANDLEFSGEIAYINMGFTGEGTTFDLPTTYDPTISDLDVYVNGIKFEQAAGNYQVVGNQLILANPIPSGDVLRLTYVEANGDIAEFIDVIYQVSKIDIGINSAIINLAEEPKGNVVLKIGSDLSGGIVLTQKKSGSIFGDYEFLTPTTIRIIDPDMVEFFSTNNPYLLISYIKKVDFFDENEIQPELRSEYTRYSGIQTSKIYKNNEGNYVYRLNYPVTNTVNLKFTVDGIGMKPYSGVGDGWDYKINESNNTEVILNTSELTTGSVLGAYYLVGEGALNVIIPGFTEEITFIDYIYSMESNYIDASTRKVITDHSSGWYPLLFRYYVEYILRGDEDVLQSNAFTFNETYKFLKRQGMAISMFMGFVKQLLPATAIIRREGVVIRNTVYTKQKFTYKRGVSFNENINWYGDNGSEFSIQYVVENSNWINGLGLRHYDAITDSGYIGSINNLISGSDLISNVDEMSGQTITFSNIWLGFYYQGKYLFVAKEPILDNVSWDFLYETGLVFGTDDYGPYISEEEVVQDKNIEITNTSSGYIGLSFKVRLLKGGNANPYHLRGGEWDVLLPNVINGVWDDLTEDDLGMGQSGSWCQETHRDDNYPNNRLIRGLPTVYDAISSPKEESSGWRPVLELIPPWK